MDVPIYGHFRHICAQLHRIARDKYVQGYARSKRWSSPFPGSKLLSESWQASLQIDLKEGEVEVGIRPEDIGPCQAEVVDLRAKVEMTSYVGSEKYIHARLGDEALTFCAPKDTALQPGNVVYLAIDPGRMHIFHKGRRI